MKVCSKRVSGKKTVFETARVASVAFLLAGGAIGVGVFSLTHAARAQKPPFGRVGSVVRLTRATVPDDKTAPAASDYTSNITPEGGDAFPTASIMVEHNGANYLMGRIFRWHKFQADGNNLVVGGEFVRSIYQVRKMGKEDNSFKFQNAWGWAGPGPGTEKPYFGMSTDAFTMPLAAVDMDPQTLLVVCANVDKNGEPIICVGNMDKMDAYGRGIDFDINFHLGKNAGFGGVDATSHGLGAVAIPRPGAKEGDPKILLVAYNTNKGICLHTGEWKDTDFTNQRWTGLDTKSAMSLGTRDDFRSRSWGGDVAVQLVPNHDERSLPDGRKINSVYPFVAYLAALCNNGIEIARIPLNYSAGNSNILSEAGKADWQLIRTGPYPSGPIFADPLTPGYVRFNQDLFGNVSVTYLDTNHHAHEIGLVESATHPAEAWMQARTVAPGLYGVDRGYPLRNRAKAAQGAASGDDLTGPKVLTPPQLTSYPDESRVANYKSPDNPDLTGADGNMEAPIMGSLLYVDKISKTPMLTVAQVGMARRRAFAPVHNKELLIGIIEGPPPYPAINLTLPDGADPTNSATGMKSTVTSTNKNTNDTTVSASYSKGPITRWDGKALAAGVGPMTDGEWSKIGTNLTEQNDGVSIDYSYTLRGGIQRDPNTSVYEARPEMMLITVGMGWGGYAYEAVDEAGHLLPGGSTFVQVFPLPSDYHNYTVYMNPKKFVPGDLDSYPHPNGMSTPHPNAMSAEAWNAKINALENASMIKGNLGERHINMAWTTTGQTATGYTASSSNTVENSTAENTKVEAGLAIEQEFKTGFFGLVSLTAAKVEAHALAGESTSSTQTFNSKNEVTQGLTCDLSIPGNGAYGGCTDFSYRVYQLQPSRAYTDELFDTDPYSAGLITGTAYSTGGFPTGSWPTNTTYRAENQRILDKIDTNSKPWKITYVVIDSKTKTITDPNKKVKPSVNRAVASAAPVAVGDLPAPLESKLTAVSLVTPSLIDIAYTAAFDKDTAAQVRAKSALDIVKIPGVSFNTAQAVSVMQALSAVEKKQVEDYLAAQDKLVRDQMAAARAAAAAAHATK